MQRRIIDATAEVCAEKGYPDAGFGEIAARAGLTRDAVQEVFAGKEEAFLELLSVEERELLGRVESACDKAGTNAPARIEGGLRSVLGWVDENPRVARVCIVEPTRATRRIFERREQTLSRLAGLLRSTAAPASAVAPEVLEDLLVAGICEVLGGRLTDGGDARSSDLAPELSELLLAPYPSPES